MSAAVPASPSVPSLRHANLGALANYAWDAEVFTATEAMAAVGLTRSTTIDVLDELVEHGIIRELPNARAAGEYRKGRPARRFELRSDAALILGIDAIDLLLNSFVNQGQRFIPLAKKLHYHATGAIVLGHQPCEDDVKGLKAE